LSEREEKGMKINEERRNKDEGIGDQKKKRGGKKNGKDKKKTRKKRRGGKQPFSFLPCRFFDPPLSRKRKKERRPQPVSGRRGSKEEILGGSGGEGGKER
jgi:hypothetical protein